MRGPKSPDFFAVWGEHKAPDQHKTPDQVATEKILAEYQRDNPEPEPSGRDLVRLETRDKMRQQKAKAEAELGKWTCRTCGRSWKTSLDVWGDVCRGCANDSGDGGVRVRGPKPRELV